MVRGTTTLELIGEPEAAALAAFDEIEDQRKRMLKVGRFFRGLRHWWGDSGLD